MPAHEGAGQVRRARARRVDYTEQQPEGCPGSHRRKVAANLWAGVSRVSMTLLEVLEEAKRLGLSLAVVEDGGIRVMPAAPSGRSAAAGYPGPQGGPSDPSAHPRTQGLTARRKAAGRTSPRRCGAR